MNSETTTTIEQDVASMKERIDVNLYKEQEILIKKQQKKIGNPLRHMFLSLMALFAAFDESDPMYSTRKSASINPIGDSTLSLLHENAFLSIGLEVITIVKGALSKKETQELLSLFEALVKVFKEEDIPSD